MLGMKTASVRVVVAMAGVGIGLLATAPSAVAAEVEPALVHATTANACKLNVREAADLNGKALTTLNCGNYTTCAQAPIEGSPCGPLVVGGTYTCVGPNNTQVTDDHWAEVAWRSPERAYVAAACAAFRV